MTSDRLNEEYRLWLVVFGPGELQGDDIHLATELDTFPHANHWRRRSNP